MLTRARHDSGRKYGYELQDQELVPGVVRPVSFLKRFNVGAAPRSAVAVNDLFEVALQIILRVGALGLSPDRWPDLCARTSRVRSSPEFFASFSEALGAVLDTNDIDPRAIFDDYRRRLHERRLAVIREPDGQRPVDFSYIGKEHLDRSIEAGGGAILWASPFAFQSVPGKRGLWEAGVRASQMSVAEHGFSSTRFGVRSFNSPVVAAENRYLASRIVFERDEVLGAVRQAIKVLKTGGVLIFTNNVHSGRSLVEVPLPRAGYIEMAQTPLSMALKHRVPLHVMTTIERVPFRTYEIRISRDLSAIDAFENTRSLNLRMAEMAMRTRDEVLVAARDAPDQFMGWNAIYLRPRLDEAEPIARADV